MAEALPVPVCRARDARGPRGAARSRTATSLYFALCSSKYFWSLGMIDVI